ncbi:MAG: zinc ribbon domain-containing protein [Acidobacteriota bacterium]
MPIYEYQCRGCGHRFEYLLRAASPAAACPGCGKTELDQLISLSGVSSEATRGASLSAAHQKAAGVRNEKSRSEHKQQHDHFGH